MTRNRRGNRLPTERWTRDCLEVRFLKREGFLDGSWVAIGPSLRWPRIARMRIARYLLTLDLQGHSVPQHIRASWTRLHFGGDRPWLHCPHCERRVAKLYRGLAGYFCRACVGNPPYATQLLSAGGRAHFKACKLRLRRGAAFTAISRATAADASTHIPAAQTRGDRRRGSEISALCANFPTRPPSRGCPRRSDWRRLLNRRRSKPKFSSSNRPLAAGPLDTGSRLVAISRPQPHGHYLAE